MITKQIGFIDTPDQGNIRPLCVRWTADNGCFGKGYPGDDGWIDWLDRNAYATVRCDFATAPDVVGDAHATLDRSLPWLWQIRALGYRAALVAQNGAEPAMMPWSEFDVLFLGGLAECIPCRYMRPIDAPKPPNGIRPRCPHCNRRVTEWKTGPVARSLVVEAKTHGKLVHMGRISSAQRYEYARYIGCDSADGTYLTYGPDKNLPHVLAWVRGADQGVLT